MQERKKQNERLLSREKNKSKGNQYIVYVDGLTRRLRPPSE